MMAWGKDDYIAAGLVGILILIGILVGLYLVGSAPGSHPVGWFFK